MQFFGHVAVVDVEGSDAGLERTQHRLQVLGAVVQVDGQVVLAALVALQLAPLGVAAEPLLDQVVGQPAGAIGELRPREATVAMHQAHLVGTRGGDRFVHVGDRELNGTHGS